MCYPKLMARNQETIEKKLLAEYKQLREAGPKEFDHCVKDKIKDLPTLKQLAKLANTGRLALLYETVGRARLEGHSWIAISAATTGLTTVRDGQAASQNYNSFCKNNNIEPVKIRGNKSET